MKKLLTTLFLLITLSSFAQTKEEINNHLVSALFVTAFTITNEVITYNANTQVPIQIKIVSVGVTYGILGNLIVKSRRKNKTPYWK